ncbi:HDOD domain-containing protein [Oceanidesulfovibrio indonesiensis]|uniref:HDOD domain-containing protein n=1 Tax=Oceanidesulfovibrio indonesiensis TaxID=54767 RepID=A0A7M3MBC9_9BACT|nr:HDOD domain-containing protein [Oceanidesulfovibrio indonesiensis]TVM14856.1 HDOD domain-containing protein [Oceanidesulfovibrio indonesiensis]
MGIINIQDVKPKMVLGADLYAPNGRFLLPKGTKLTNKHVRVLSIWGVPEADIEGADREKTMGEAIAQLSPETLHACEARASELFSRANLGHEAVRELYQISLLRCAERNIHGAELCSGHINTDIPPELLQHCGPNGDEIPSAMELVRRHVNLASLPDIYYRVVEVISDPKSSAATISDVISKDVSLSAKLLKLVNSPFYGFPSKIDSINRAVALLGFNELATLAHGITVIRHFEDMPLDGLDMHSFWKHSVACGLIARALAGRRPGLSEERFFVAGLLHDIGRLVMLKEIPHLMGKAMLHAAENNLEMWRAERDILGYDHGMVAGFLMEEWLMPVDLRSMVSRHHSPVRAENTFETSFIHLADIMTIAMEMGCSGTCLVPPLQADVWDVLDLPQGLLITSVRQTDRQLEEIVSMFFSGQRDER